MALAPPSIAPVPAGGCALWIRWRWCECFSLDRTKQILSLEVGSCSLFPLTYLPLSSSHDTLLFPFSLLSRFLFFHLWRLLPSIVWFHVSCYCFCFFSGASYCPFCNLLAECECLVHLPHV